MSVFKNININEYFCRYGIKNGLKRASYISFPFHIVKDYQIKKVLYYRKIYKYFVKKYDIYAYKEPEDLLFTGISCENPIWVYWAQGIEQAPEIVKKCVESIKKNTDQKLILLDNNNINEYIIFPKYIVSKYKKRILSDSAYSDLIRFSLLGHYGGTWMDATIFLTGKLQSYITNSLFFAYRDSFGLIENPALYASWLLHAEKNNPIVLETRNMAFAYIKNEKHIAEYLWIYMFITMSVNKHPDIYVPYVNSDYGHVLFDNLDKPFDKKIYSHILELSNVHKLSYKLTCETLQSENTFYRHIIDQENKNGL